MFVRKVLKFIATLLSVTVVVDAVTVHLNIINDKCSEDNTIHYVFKGSNLHFKVSDKFPLVVAWCHDYNGISQNTKNMFWSQVDQRRKTFTFTNVSTDMSALLKCTLLRERDKREGETNNIYAYENKNYTAIDCKVYIVVITGCVNVTTNGKELGARFVDHTTSRAEYQYDYQYGEIVDTTCSRTHNIGGLRIEYHDANNTTLFSMKSFVYNINPNFRAIMKLERNNSYLDCIYEPLESSQIFVYRTYYIIKTVNRAAHVLVNGIKLVQRPIKISKSTLAEFEYYYINGEPLDIECRVNNEDIKFSRRYNGSTVTEHCGTNPMNQFDIIFKSELVSNRIPQGPRITGLRANSILYQHTSGDNEWTIHYQYAHNETLKLSCVYSAIYANYIDITYSLLWTFRKGTIRTFPQNKNKTYDIIWNKERKFTLEDADNMTSIICFANSSRIKGDIPQVVLKLYAMSSPVVHTPTEEVKDTASHATVMEGANSEGNEDSNLGWVIAGGTVGTVFIVAGLCVPMACRLVKTRARRRCENPHYENIDDNDRQIPIFPSQWNDYTESYSHYTEIDDGHMVINNYYQGTKQEQSPNETPNYYSEINVVVAGSGGNSVEYAEVIKKGRNGRSDKYSNVQDGRRYANTNSNEDYAYAEPTYSSIQLADGRRPYGNSSQIA